MKPDLDPWEIDRLAAKHEQQLRDTQKLYGQRNDIDQPSYDERLPFEGFLEAIADLATRLAEWFVVALVIIMVFCLSQPAASTP